MLPIPIMQAGPQYVIHDGSFEDEEGVILSLKAKGLSQENLMKAVEGLVRDGAYTIQHASCKSPETEGVVAVPVHHNTALRALTLRTRNLPIYARTLTTYDDGAVKRQREWYKKPLV